MSHDEAATAAAPEALAQRCAQAMSARDHASQALGITIEAIGPGMARLRMTVRRDMLNGFHSCHGGFIFALADSAFAFACNSRNEATVAAGCSIEFLRPVTEGEVLTATAQEQALAGRSGVYDIIVRNANDETVALFRGKSHRIKGEVIDPILTGAT